MPGLSRIIPRRGILTPPRHAKLSTFLRTVPCGPNTHEPVVPEWKPETETVIFLGTPQFARYLTEFKKTLSERKDLSQRKFIGAIVDSVPGPDGAVTVRHGYSWYGVSERLSARTSKEPHSITFSSGDLKICIPLANTLFETGTRSVCTHDSAEIALPGAARPIHSVPFVPLTAPRRIASCYGNILQTLESSDGNLPASAELEVAVSNLMVEKPHIKNLDIFAYITDSLPLPGAPMELLRSNGRLHKVLSGGGGWGAKTGLLSLDPQDDGGTETEFHEGMLHGEGSTVKAGEWVSYGYTVNSFFHYPHNRILFGTVRRAEELQVPRKHRNQMRDLTMFGGGSEKGLRITVDNRVKRLDMPGSTISLDME